MNILFHVRPHPSIYSCTGVFSVRQTTFNLFDRTVSILYNSFGYLTSEKQIHIVQTFKILTDIPVSVIQIFMFDGIESIQSLRNTHEKVIVIRPTSKRSGKCWTAYLYHRYSFNVNRWFHPSSVIFKKTMSLFAFCSSNKAGVELSNTNTNLMSNSV